MKLQELIDSTDLDMTEMQVKAYFLGVLCAEKPMPFNKALEELLHEDPDALSKLEAPLKPVFEELRKNVKSGLQEMFPKIDDIHTFMELAKEQLDFFLTGMSLSGTNTESCDDEELAGLIEELEDTVEDMDDYLADEDATDADGNDFKEFLLGTWEDFVSSK